MFSRSEVCIYMPGIELTHAVYVSMKHVWHSPLLNGIHTASTLLLLPWNLAGVRTKMCHHFLSCWYVQIIFGVGFA